VFSSGKLYIKVKKVDIDFKACQGLNGNNNDLYAYYKRLVDENLVTDQTVAVKRRLVGDNGCPGAIRGFLKSQLADLGL